MRATRSRPARAGVGLLLLSCCGACAREPSQQPAPAVEPDPIPRSGATELHFDRTTEPPVRAAGWTQDLGAHYLEIANRTLIGTGGYRANGASVTLEQLFVDTSMQVYAEYGVLEWLTAVVNLTPIGWAGIGENQMPYIGPLIGGARMGTAIEALDDLRVAAEVHYGYNPGFGERKLAAGLVGRELWHYTPSVETHVFDVEAQLGYALPLGVWTSVAAGGRYRTRATHGVVLYGRAQVGVNGPFGLIGEGHFGWYQPTLDVQTSNIAGAGATRYLAAGGSLAWWPVPGWGISLGVDGGFGVQSNVATPALLFALESR